MQLFAHHGHTHSHIRTHAQTHRLEAQMVKWGFVCVCLCVSGVLGMIKFKTFHLSLCLSSRSTGSRLARPGGSRGNLWWFTLAEFLEVLTVITECPGTPRVGLRHAPTFPVCLSPAYWWVLLPVLALNLVWQWGHIFVLCHVVLLTFDGFRFRCYWNVPAPSPAGPHLTFCPRKAAQCRAETASECPPGIHVKHPPPISRSSNLL